MKTKHFFNQLEHDRIIAAIQAAERGTSGDIVLFITHHAVKDALPAAHDVFTKRHLEKAADDNSLLIFLAPKSQTFAVVGGKLLHDRVGQAWWDGLIETLRHHFKQGRFTDGLVAAIEKSGQALRQHFPAQGVDRTGQSDILED